MSIFLDRIDSSPLANVQMDGQLFQWLCVLVDALNENLRDLQDSLNVVHLTPYTAAQIVAMNVAGDLADGVVLFDGTNQVYVGRQSGVLTKFITASYP